ncbi:putative pyridoxine 5'-phosphate oxidase superfamily flavin-nucleotide-binding protein [Pseudonocardia eucalypti]|uniref:pyridoxamine 5'-phosphate oxidase family protein n=1 Tax=Pseudonocardia eucalypti TaxID=648755 RepID=UPI00160CEDAD|nr:putative pyridoxine 5'-phosphate oxidase superfamily flavin-nucleotide-binding protein [Pseudonocardia eucalypti]
MTGHEGPVTGAVRAFIEYQRLCYVATVGPDGEPNLSPKGSLKVLSEHELAFADMASPRTVANLRTNPRLEINLVDPFLRRGYRIKGTGRVVDDPEVLAVVGQGLGHDYPVRAAVRIAVTEVRPVDSPVYLFTDTPSDQVHAMWQDNYGYHRDPEGREV